MKILIIGRPKSGTSMLAGKLKAGLDAHFHINSQLLFEPRGENWLEQLKANNVTKVLYSSNPHHISTLEDAIEISKHFDKKVIICRDPRDILISDTLYRWFHRHNPKSEYFQLALSLLLKKEKKPESVNLYEISSISINRGIPVSLERYKKNLKAENDKFSEPVLKLHSHGCHLVKYEDIISQENTHLNQYLGFSISSEIKSQKKAFLRTARSKTFGNWRNWFTREDIIFFKPLLEKSLSNLGYNINDWELNQSQNIDPHISSNYVKKLFNGEGDFQ